MSNRLGPTTNSNSQALLVSKFKVAQAIYLARMRVHFPSPHTKKLHKAKHQELHP